MSDELWYLQEALAMRERLRVLADLQAAYWEALVERGFDPGVATQFTSEWSSLAYGMTFQAHRAPVGYDDLDQMLDRALDGSLGAHQPPAPGQDPSSVPEGEPWLVLSQDLEDGDVDGRDHRDAA